MSDAWTLKDTESGNERTFDSRSEAEDAQKEMENLGANVELLPPGKTDGGSQATDETPADEPREAEVVDHVPGAGTHEPEYELDERSVAEDPLDWVPGDFIDEIDGSLAINRKGFEVLSHFYGIDVHTEIEVPPEETDHEFCRARAVATTEDGRECEAHGSAHVDRGDDSFLLLEMADTRARKRALSIATGVGAVAVEELKSEVDA